MSDNREPDFGAAHGVGMLVEDGTGMMSVAFYEDGVWWEGHPFDGKSCTRLQLDNVPVRLVDPAVLQTSFTSGDRA